MLSNREIAQGYDALPESTFMPSKYHRFCIDLAGHLRGAVLDMGCGPGRLLDSLGARSREVRLYGCDLSFQQCLNAARKPFHPHICRTDAEKLPFKDNSFDTIFMIEVLDHFSSPAQALREARRVLKPGGQLVISVPNRDWLRYDEYMRDHRQFQPVDDHWFTRREIRGLLTEAGYEIENMRGGENLYFGGGVLRLLERIATALFHNLETRMKRLILVSRNKKG